MHMVGIQISPIQLMYPWYGALAALQTTYTTTWSTNMVDPLNEMLLVVTVPVTIVLLGAIYAIGRAYLETRDDCAHTWSRWSDPQKTEGHPHQTRSCNKCNMHQSRLVQ